MNKYSIEIKIGDRYQQKRSKRICRITKVGNSKIQYMYEDKIKSGYPSRYVSALTDRFVVKFTLIPSETYTN